MSNETKNLYAERDAMELDQIGGHYFKHVMAMTSESLHSKSDIAAELGWRDCQIEQLEQQLAESQSKLEKLAAENAGLKSKGREVLKEAAHVYSHFNQMVDHLDGESIDGQTLHEFQVLIESETPETDSFLAEVRASAITEYANKRGFSFQHGSIHAHFGNGDVMVGSVTFENGDAGINFAPVREKIGGVGTDYEWTKGKTAEQVDSVFVIASGNSEGLEVIRDKLSDAISQLRQGGAA